MTDIEIHKLAVKEINEYLDMGCFKEPDNIFAPLVEGYTLGFKESQKIKSELKTKAKRPLNVDLRIGLRIIGNSKNTFEISTDEGDGYEFMQVDMDEPEKRHYEEWIEQLRCATEWLENKIKGSAKC